MISSGFPIAGATFTQDGYLLQKIASSNVGTLGLVLLLLIRLYSGWGYAGSRLQSKVIEYEGKKKCDAIPLGMVILPSCCVSRLSPFDFSETGW